VPTHAVGSGNSEWSIAAARITTHRICFTPLTRRRIHHIHLVAGLYQFEHDRSGPTFDRDA
jgi:hypothetical protein